MISMTEFLKKSANDEFEEMLSKLSQWRIKRSEEELQIKEDVNWNKYKVIKQVKEFLIISWKDIFVDLWLKIAIQLMIIGVMFWLYHNLDFFYSLFNDYYLAHYIFYIGILLFVIEILLFWLKIIIDINLILYKHIKLEKEEEEIVIHLDKDGKEIVQLSE